MKILYKLFVVIVALILELVLLEFGSELLFGMSHGMMADARYRRVERLAAFRDSIEHPSPATKAAFQDEMRLMHRHEDWKWQLVLGILVVINGVGIYYYFRHDHRETTA